MTTSEKEAYDTGHAPHKFPPSPPLRVEKDSEGRLTLAPQRVDRDGRPIVDAQFGPFRFLIECHDDGSVWRFYEEPDARTLGYYDDGSGITVYELV